VQLVVRLVLRQPSCTGETALGILSLLSALAVTRPEVR
jgi:hypothetical protein